MVQFARPDADEVLGTWTDDGSGTTDIFQAIDEIVRSDTDFIITANNPSGDIYRAQLSNVTDPLVNTGHICRYAYGKDAGARTGEILVALMQGASTVIHEETHSDVGAGFTPGTFTLTGGEADNITDYSDLRVRITANTSGGGSPQQGQVSWFELEVPNALVTVEIDHDTDSILLAIKELEHTTDSILKEIDKELNHTTDSYLLAKKEIDHDTDSILKALGINGACGGNPSAIFGLNDDQAIETFATYTTQGEADANWQTNNTNCRVDIGADVLRQVARRDAGLEQSMFSIPNIDDKVWALRLKYTPTTLTPDNTQNDLFFGITDETFGNRVNGSVNDAILIHFRLQTNGNFLNQLAYKDDVSGLIQSTIGTNVLTQGNPAWFELVRINATKIRARIYGDSSFTTLLAETQMTIPSTIDGLNNFFLENRTGSQTDEGVLNSDFDDIEFVNGGLFVPEQSVCHDTDSVLKKLDNEIDHTTDSFLVSIVEILHTTDSILKALGVNGSCGGDRIFGLADNLDIEEFDTYTTQGEANTNWTPNDDVAGKRVNISSDVLEYLCVNDSSNDALAFDLGFNLSEIEWVFRCKLSVIDLDPGDASNKFCWIAISDKDETSGESVSQDYLAVRIEVDSGESGEYFLVAEDGGSGSGAGFSTPVPFNGSVHYLEMRRLSATSFEVAFFSDSKFTNLISSIEHTIPATIGSLRYLKLMNRDAATNTGHIQVELDDFQLADGVTNLGDTRRQHACHFTNSILKQLDNEIAHTTDSYLLAKVELTHTTSSVLKALGVNGVCSSPQDPIFGLSGQAGVETFATYTTQGEADTNWPTTDSAEIKVDIIGNEIDQDVKSDGTNDTVVFDLGAPLSDIAWTIKVRISNVYAGQGDDDYFFGISSADESVNTESGNHNWLGVRWDRSLATSRANIELSYKEGAGALTETASPGTQTGSATRYYKITRTSATNLKVEIFQDAAYSILLLTTNGTIPAGVTGLQFIKIGNDDLDGAESALTLITYRNIIVADGNANFVEPRQHACHTTDSILKEIDNEIAHTTDSILKEIDIEIAHTTDSFLSGDIAVEKDHTTDSILKQLDNEIDHDTDSILKEIDKELTHDTDSYLLAKKELEHTTDSILKEIDKELTHDTDSYLLAKKELEHTTDSVLGEREPGFSIEHDTDSILKEIDKEITHDTDSYLLAKKELEHDTDSILKEIGREVAHTTDSFIGGDLIVEHDTDSILKEIDKELTHDTDSILKQLDNEIDHDTDSYLLAKKELEHTTDSILKEIDKELTHDTDSILKEIDNEISHDTDSYLLAIKELEHTTDSILKEIDKELEHTTDSYLLAVKDLEHTTDSVLGEREPGFSIEHDTDSILKQLDNEIDHDTDSILLEIDNEISHDTDSILLGKIPVTHDTDSILKEIDKEIAHNTDSFLAIVTELEHTTDSILKEIGREVLHTTDSFLATLGQVSLEHDTDSILLEIDNELAHTTDSLLIDTDVTKQHATDSYLLGIQTVFHTTNSILSEFEPGISITHTTDSVLAFVKVHTTDSVVFQSVEPFHTTDSVVVPTGAGGTKLHTTDSIAKALGINGQCETITDSVWGRFFDQQKEDFTTYPTQGIADSIWIPVIDTAEGSVSTDAQVQIANDRLFYNTRNGAVGGSGFNHTYISRALGFTAANSGDWISRFTLDFVAIQKLGDLQRCAVGYMQSPGAGYISIDFLGIKIETDVLRTTIYLAANNTSSQSTVAFSHEPLQGDKLGVEFVKVDNDEWRVSLYTSDFRTLIESHTFIGGDVANATNLDTFGISNRNQTGPLIATVQTIAVDDIQFKADSQVILLGAQNVCHFTDSIVRKLDNELAQTTDSVLARGVHHFTDSVLTGPVPPITHDTDSVLKDTRIITQSTDSWLMVRLDHTTDSVFLGKIPVTHDTDSVLKRLNLTVNHTTDSFVADDFDTSTITHDTDSLLKGSITPIHTTDSVLGRAVRHTTDSSLVNKIPIIHKTSSILKAITTVTHNTDSFLADRPLLTHTTDSILRELDTELAHTTDSWLNATKTLTHDTDSILLEITSLTHTTDSSLKGSITPIHTTDSWLKDLPLPQPHPDVNVRMDSIVDINVRIDKTSDIQTYLNTDTDIEVYG